MKELVDFLINNRKTISTMESCTGGYIVSEITNIEGSSEVLKYSAVTYSNEYKIKMGVSKKIIDRYSVYSMETAKEMSRVISNYTNSSYGIGVTGKLNRIDINNNYGNDNEVFISIYDRDNNRYYTDSLKVTNSSRIKNKKEVCNKLIELFKRNNGGSR
ncbi:MAG: nicotinamide-nucleotide amidohydrolase family protein [Bacilli bacterium]|nr:nicotinamide-nucleotide amidohydrolase family protein [Bacilli bacterium]